MDKKENIIYVGAKEYKIYHRAIMGVFDRGSKEVFVKTRGKHIKNAIDITLFAERVSEGKVKIKDVKIKDDKFVAEDGKERRVSEINIQLIKE